MSSLNKEVVTGIVQVIKYAQDRVKAGSSSISLSDLANAGYKGRDEDAKTHIFEFVKDGLGSLTIDIQDRIAVGNYDDVWKMTNGYFNRIGMGTSEPEPIDPDFTEL
jgi:hypothetical protein